jgi:Ca2+-binding RTX toxin-like protein
MQVKGENTFLYDVFGRQNFQEAAVKRERQGGFFGLFGTQKLTIDAGAGDDVIQVKKAGPNQYEIDINGQKFILSEAEMKNLTLRGGAGNDTIIIDDSVDIAINVEGGAGDDTIVNFADGVRLEGGAGDDTIVSIANFVKVMGGAGRDNIHVHGHFNSVHGDDGRSDFWAFFFGGVRDEPDNLNVNGHFNSVHED